MSKQVMTIVSRQLAQFTFEKYCAEIDHKINDCFINAFEDEWISLERKIRIANRFMSLLK
jgi:hypothetical protein